MKISDLLAQAKNKLENSGVSSSGLDSLVLLTHALSFSKEQVIFNPDLDIAPNQVTSFFAMIARRCNREPVSHILGKREFYGHNFLVTNKTLDPRPDSESLIELVRKKFPHKDSAIQILELGTGTGCLIITLLKLYPNANAEGLDISSEALEICQKNSALNEVDERLNLRKSNLFSEVGLEKKFDLIISNPPYIPSQDINDLQEEVCNFEPHLALDGGIDGLDFYREIAKNAATFLQKNGRIIVEIGHDQQQSVKQIFAAENFIFEESQRDLPGIERALSFKTTL